MVWGVDTQGINESKAFAFIYGSFTGSGWSIPYLTIAPKFADAAAALKTSSDLPESDQQEWKLEGLFQRDITWPRVEYEIIPYLRQEADPAFFNSITIAMVPYDQENNVLLEDFRSFEGFRPPELTKGPLVAKTLEVGPISLAWYQDWNDIQQDDAAQQGFVQWNLDQVHGIAIDGQHRLAAIKKIIDKGAWAAKFRNARVPVIVLIFDEQLGFHAPPEANDRTLLELIRTLFVDLNKHAREVHRTRVILLEDGEPHARCVREVLAEGIARDIAALSADKPRLPLSLVDWHSEGAKFNEGPYLTSVLTLDWIVARVLGRKTVSDYTNYAQTKRELTDLETSLGINLTRAKQRLESNHTDQIPFGYRADEVDKLAAAFSNRYTESICYLLSQFKPYSDLIDLRQHQDSLGLEFSHWHYLNKRRGNQGTGEADNEYHRWLEQLAGRPGDSWSEGAFEECLNNIEAMKDQNLAFNVAFQRAYVAAWLEYRKFQTHEFDEIEGDDWDYGDFGHFDEPDDLDVAEAAGEDDGDPEPDHDALSLPPPEEDRMASTREFVSALNTLVAGWGEILSPRCVIPEAQLDLAEGRKALSQQFWGGSLYNTANQTIDFTQTASNRATDLIFMIAAMISFDNRNEPNTTSDFYEFWNNITMNDDAPSFYKRIKRAVNRQIRDVNPQGFATRILAQQELDYDRELALIEVEVRLRYVWNTLGL
jgi:hypothetical protein